MRPRPAFARSARSRLLRSNAAGDVALLARQHEGQGHLVALPQASCRVGFLRSDGQAEKLINWTAAYLLCGLRELCGHNACTRVIFPIMRRTRK